MKNQELSHDERMFSIVSKCSLRFIPKKELEKLYTLCNPIPTTEDDWLYTCLHDKNARQFAIDLILKGIATSLLYKGGWFKQQDIARERVEVNVVKNKTRSSVPRNLMRSMLEREKEIVETINDLKKKFGDIINYAEKLGFEVFARGENKYHIYYALEVDYAEIVRDAELHKI